MGLDDSFEYRLRAFFDTDDGRSAVVSERLGDLQKALRSAVPTYLGLRLTLVSHGYPITVMALEPNATDAMVLTSLRMNLGWLLPAEGDDDGTLVVYAATPGTFVDLAADLDYALGRHDGVIVLDEDVGPLMERSAVLSGEELTMINYAIGVLIDRGHAPERASLELQHQAGAAQVSLLNQATAVVESAAAGARH